MPLISITSTWICASVNMPPFSFANAGMRELFRPLARTRCNSSCGTMARKSGSFNGGAGPSFPSLPWHPAKFCPYRTLNFRLCSGDAGRSAAVGRPGGSHPVTSKDRDKARRGAQRGERSLHPLHRQQHCFVRFSHTTCFYRSCDFRRFNEISLAIGWHVLSFKRRAWGSPNTPFA